MKFTLVFDNKAEAMPAVVSVQYTPCVEFRLNGKHSFFPHRDRPQYEKGDIRDYIEKLINDGIDFDNTASMNVALVVHTRVGHGEKWESVQLEFDLMDLGYKVTPVFL